MQVVIAMQIAIHMIAYDFIYIDLLSARYAPKNWCMKAIYWFTILVTHELYDWQSALQSSFTSAQRAWDNTTQQLFGAAGSVGKQLYTCSGFSNSNFSLEKK